MKAATDSELIAVRSNHARFMLSLPSGKPEPGISPVGPVVGDLVIMVRRAAEAVSRLAKVLVSLVAADGMER
jgi:hypothetical protein